VTGFINYIYVIIYAIKKRFDIGTVIFPRAFVLDRVRRPRANTTAREQITVPISNIKE